MYYQPKPICSQRLTLSSLKNGNSLIKKLGRGLLITLLVLTTAELFALLENPKTTSNVQQVTTNQTAVFVDLSDSYLK